VGACGTAVVLTPVNKVTYGDKVISIGNYDDKPGPTLQKLYDRVRALQNGEEEDKFGWMVEV
jgi:branched-chain amino acid aminotransferase